VQRNAPVSYRTLRPGLDDDALAMLEDQYGFPLHSELRTLLSWHDGCTHDAQALQIWTDFQFGESQFMCDQVQDWDDNYWDRHWVPFATDLGLKKLVVDHGTLRGRVMYFDGVDGIDDTQTWPSLAALIGQVRHALTTSSLLNGRRAAVDGGSLHWPPAI